MDAIKLNFQRTSEAFASATPEFSVTFNQTNDGPEKFLGGFYHFKKTGCVGATCQLHDSGADRDRTDDLRLAKPALSQLSYSPVKGDAVVTPVDMRAEAGLGPHRPT